MQGHRLVGLGQRKTRYVTSMRVRGHCLESKWYRVCDAHSIWRMTISQKKYRNRRDVGDTTYSSRPHSPKDHRYKPARQHWLGWTDEFCGALTPITASVAP